MQLLSNWKSVAPANYRILLIAGLCFAIAVGGSLVAFVRNPSPVFSWQQLQELQSQELPMYSFEVGSVELTIPSENHILFERWTGNPITPNQSAWIIYLTLFGIALALLLSLISTLSRYWFYLGSAAIAYLLTSFQWPGLRLFGLQNQIPLFMIVTSILGLGVYFQFFRRTATMQQRLLAYGLFVLMMFTVVKLGARIPYGLQVFAANTLQASIIVTLFFLFLVAHEIVAVFLTMTTSRPSGNNLRQFLFISGIYLLNVWLAYWDRIGWLKWSYTVSPFLLMTTSGLLMIWNVRKRQAIYDNILYDESFTSIFFLSLGTIAFSTYGYFYATSNDIALLSLNDLTIYFHIGFGMMLLVYIASNFLGLFGKNLAVYKVLYKPTSMPYFTYRFGGIIFTLALIFYNTWTTPLNHFISGYYTSLGDTFHGRDFEQSFSYFQRAHIYAPYNQHASTALSEMEGVQGNYARQLKYSEDASRFQPTEFTILNTDNLYLRFDDAYDDLHLLRRGKDEIPGSGIIQNNLGLFYSRTNSLDSAKRYFLAAQRVPIARNTAELNLLGLLAKTGSQVKADSIYRKFINESNGVRSNAIAFANQQGTALDIRITLPQDSILDLFSASLIGNYLTNQNNQADTAFISACIAIARKEENAPFKSLILVPAARSCYTVGQVSRAFELMQEAIMSGTNSGACSHTLGLFAMNQRKADVAAVHFQFALSHGYQASVLPNAAALAEGGRIDEAIIAWDTISKRKDSLQTRLGESMKRVLGAPLSWFADLTDQEKYEYSVYRVSLEDSVLFNSCLSQIRSDDLRAMAVLLRAEDLLDREEIQQAVRQFQKIRGLRLKDERLFANLKYFELRLAAKQRQARRVEELIGKGIVFGPYRETERVYYRAVLSEMAGDTLHASRDYTWVSMNNPYFDDGVVAAANFHRDRKGGLQKSYTILSEALQVNRNSVPILKAYIPIALEKGFTPYAVGALETLKGRISKRAFDAFIAQKQLASLLSQ